MQNFGHVEQKIRLFQPVKDQSCNKDNHKIGGKGICSQIKEVEDRPIADMRPTLGTGGFVQPIRQESQRAEDIDSQCQMNELRRRG